MARCSSNTVAAAAAAAAMMMMMMIMSPGVASLDECPSGWVYPYRAFCSSPAKYAYDGGVFELAAAPSGDTAYTYTGGLAPEWDETNSTYYVRLAEDAAKYEFRYLSPGGEPPRSAVALSDYIRIWNVESQRPLGWRQEGDEYFLVELEGRPGSGVNLQFSRPDTHVPLFCPPIESVQCEAYNILNFETSVGLTPYVEDGATYFKQSDSSNALPFVLFDKRSSTSGSVDIKMPTVA